jgi:hypothetical protein
MDISADDPVLGGWRNLGDEDPAAGSSIIT